MSEGASAVPPFVEVEVCFGIENGEDVGKDPNTIDFRLLLLSPGFQTPLPGSRDSLKLKLNVEPQPEIIFISEAAYTFTFSSSLTWKAGAHAGGVITAT